MPILQVPSVNVEFFYLDSGRPDVDDYTTIIIVHGHTFHSATFSPLFPVAPAKGLRIIAVNRRDYLPTTEFSAEELAQLSSPDISVHQAFLEARGRELALFTSQLIEELKLPPPSEDGTRGGIMWMGWSMGSVLTVPAIPATLGVSEPAKSKVLQYVRRHIIYDTPGLVLGLDQPPKAYAPLFDEDIPEDQRGPIFADWISSFFDHPDLASRDYNTLEYRVPNKDRKGTVARMSQEELESCLNPAPGFRSEQYLLTTFPPALRQQREMALYDPSVSAAWHKSKVWVLYGDKASWYQLHTPWELERIAKEKNKLDRIGFRDIKGANHFITRDDPLRALDEFLYCLKN